MSAALALAPAQALRLKPVTLPMRIALGLLHIGALFKGAGGLWRGRAFPDEPVREGTVQGLVLRGLARLETLEGLRRDPRRVCLATAEGRALYRDGRFAHRTPPPAAAETVLRDVEQLVDGMQARETRLDRLIAQLGTEARETRAAARRIEQRIAGIEARAAQLDREREEIAANRATLGAVTAQACERLGETLAEAGR